jgi:hypothetical protein
VESEVLLDFSPAKLEWCMTLRVIAEQLSADSGALSGERVGLILDNLGIREDSVSALFTASSISNLDTREPSFDALDRSCGQGCVLVDLCGRVGCVTFLVWDGWSVEAIGSHGPPLSQFSELVFSFRWGIRSGGGRRSGAVISGLSKRTGELGIEVSVVTDEAIVYGI